MERVNIVLTKESLRKLDELRKKKGWVSRGKTVEFMVEVLHDIETEYEELHEFCRSYGELFIHSGDLCRYCSELCRSFGEKPLLQLLLRLAKFS